MLHLFTNTLLPAVLVRFGSIGSLVVLHDWVSVHAQPDDLLRQQRARRVNALET